MQVAPSPESRRCTGPKPTRCSLVVALLAASVFTALLVPSTALAQMSCSSVEECSPHRPRLGLEQEARFLAVNAALGGVTAGIIRVARGGAFLDGFWAGALGGAAVYGGKRVAVEEFGGAGFLGRGMASVGGSVVRNASTGRGMLEEVVLPVGPVRLYVSRNAGVRARMDVATLAAGAAFVIAHDARLDAGASLSAGALVFRGTAPIPGLSSAGAMMVWEDLPAGEGPRLMAHERVHVLQYDQAFLSWGEPLERWLLGRSALPESLLGFLDIGGLPVAAQAGLSLTVDYADRPWEVEAYFLAETAHPVHEPGSHAGHAH